MSAKDSDGEIRIGPGVGQRFRSPRVKAHSWQKGIVVTCGLIEATQYCLTSQSNIFTSY